MSQFVQIIDGKIAAIVSCLQDDEHMPGVVEVDDDDSRYVAYITPAPVIAITDPVEKLKNFLTANPDVAAILK